MVLVERGAQCLATEIFSCARGADGEAPARVRTCVWSKDGDVLGVVATDGGAYIIARDGRVNLHVFQRVERPRPPSLLGAVFGGRARAAARERAPSSTPWM